MSDRALAWAKAIADSWRWPEHSPRRRMLLSLAEHADEGGWSYASPWRTAWRARVPMPEAVDAVAQMELAGLLRVLVVAWPRGLGEPVEVFLAIPGLWRPGEPAAVVSGADTTSRIVWPGAGRSWGEWDRSRIGAR